MSVDSKLTTTRVWSCATLEDGMEQLVNEANQVAQEELDLMKLIEDHIYIYIYIYIHETYGAWNVNQKELAQQI